MKQTSATSNETARILVIDDETANIKLIESAIHRFRPWFVSTASGGEEAKLVANAFPPDIIILHVNLQDTTGTSLLAHFKSEPTTANVPIIIISADDCEDKAREFIKSGAHEYVSQPYEVPDLICRVQLALEKTANCSCDDA